MRRSLRALIDGVQIKQIPWLPPVVIRYIRWLSAYMLNGLKVWDMEGFHHTVEWINMYIMFENIAIEAKNDNLRRKVTEKTTAAVETKTQGNMIRKTYKDKVNFGDPNSPAIDFLRNYKAEQNKNGSRVKV